jgi:ABC-type lipoprotein release transport system permease subunit
MYDTLGGDAGIDAAALLARLESVEGVDAAAPRAIGFGLVSTGPRSAGAQLLGVDPVREAAVTRLLGAVVDGEGLAGAPPQAVLLGKTLADDLGARVGDELAVVTQAADGSLGNELLHVRGLVRTGLVPLDRGLAIMGLADLQALMALGPGRLHEIALRIDDPEQASAVATRLPLPARLRASSWETLAPALVEYVGLVRGWSWVMVVIVGLFAAFGVLNTMLMAVFERTHEIGMLASLGVRPVQVLVMVLAETVCLAAVGLVLGTGLGGLGMAYFAWHGWDLSRWAEGLTVAGVLVDPVLRAVFSWRSAPSAALVLGGILTLAGLLPAARAARMKPVEALAARDE